MCVDFSLISACGLHCCISQQRGVCQSSIFCVFKTSNGYRQNTIPFSITSEITARCFKIQNTNNICIKSMPEGKGSRSTTDERWYNCSACRRSSVQSQASPEEGSQAEGGERPFFFPRPLLSQIDQQYDSMGGRFRW